MGGSRGRREATGRGIMIVCDEAVKKLGLRPEETRVIVQGFGNVGSNCALLMSQAGYKIVGVIEVDGAIYNKNGIDMDALWKYRERTKKISGFSEAEAADPDAIVGRFKDVVFQKGVDRPRHRFEMLLHRLGDLRQLDLLEAHVHRILPGPPERREASVYWDVLGAAASSRASPMNNRDLG